MSNTKNPHRQQLASTLEEFVQSVYWSEDLTPQQARANLERGLVEIICLYQHSSNGLLITENGYFITAAHCLGDDVFLPQIKLHDGNRYSVEKVCVLGKRGRGSVDLVIAKAGLPGPCKPIKYKFFKGQKVENVLISTLTRWDGTIKSDYGHIDSEFFQDRTIQNTIPPTPQFSMSIKDYFVISYTSKPVNGDSGGVIVSPVYELVGFCSGGIPAKHEIFGVKFFRALELISKYVLNLRQR